MGVRLNEDGLEQVIGGATYAAIAWPDVVHVAASCSDHMTQRVPMLSVASAVETIDVGEGEAGWDALVAELGAHLDLTVPSLAAALATLRTDQSVTLFSR